jgi:hypothetical protein
VDLLNANQLQQCASRIHFNCLTIRDDFNPTSTDKFCYFQDEELFRRFDLIAVTKFCRCGCMHGSVLDAL